MVAAGSFWWRQRRLFWVAGLALAVSLSATPASGQLTVGDLCRVKGQEENTLHGLGLVVGLEGTGDTETLTVRALAKMLELMGNPVSQNAAGEWNFDELSNTNNVATVLVSATIPPGGARQGDTLNCQVNAISAASLEGGYLMMTPLVGPRPGSPRVYGFCQGPIALDQSGPPTSGNIHGGCRLEEDFHNNFVKDGKITLVLDKEHASFDVAYAIEENVSQVAGLEGIEAKAIDQVNIEVTIPPTYEQSHVHFASIVLETRIIPPRHDARVLIDKRNGTIIVGKNVMIGTVAVSHNNIAVQTGTPAGPLVVLEQAQTTTRLQALVDALNGLRVGTDDIISIIESLHESRALYGRLVVR